MGVRRHRTRSIRRMIFSLLAVPVAALVVLWGITLSATLQDSLRLLQAKDYLSKVVEPVRELTISLQAERRMSMAFLGEDPAIGLTGLQAQRLITDRAAGVVQGHTESDGYTRATNELTRDRTQRVLDRLDGLAVLREAVTASKIDAKDVLRQYTDLVVAANLIYDAAETGDADINRDTRIQVGLADAFELLNYEDALLSGALTAGAPGPGEHTEFVKTVGAQRARYAELIRQMNPTDALKLSRLHRSEHYLDFARLEDALVADRGTGAAPTIDAGQWHTAAERWQNDLTDYVAETQADLAVRAISWATGVVVRLVLTAGVGLIAIIVAVGVGWRLARRLIVENRRMVRALETFTNERLPAIPALVQQGVEIDLDADVRPGAYTITEIARVFDAFDGSRRAVVAATVSEAAARRGLRAVFVNLARREQVLLRRLLKMLDGMERKAKSPEDLNDLFAIDHLVTRMRRHAEGLIILAGQSAGRTWRRPVPLVDVVRGAVAEVEDYTRVRLAAMPDAALSGTVAADVIHLLAELIENAVMYSPPDMHVEVSGQLVAHGLAVEIEDRGLGLDEARLASFNTTLAEAPDFDLFDSARLGLFVIARLARRHDIRVHLKPSPYGGVTAVTLIPGTLLARPGASPDPLPEPEPEAPPAEARPRVRMERPVIQAPATEGGLPQRVRAARPSAATPEPDDEPAAPSGHGLAEPAGAAHLAAPTGPEAAARTVPPTTQDPLTAADDTGTARRSGTTAEGEHPAASGDAGARAAGPHGGGEPAASGDERAVRPAGERPVASGEAEAARATEPRGGEPAESEAAPAAEEGELPRRVRQRSLAPQLRGRETGGEPAGSGDGIPAVRPPEEARSVLSAMQKGWQRGRAEVQAREEGTDDRER